MIPRNAVIFLSLLFGIFISCITVAGAVSVAISPDQVGEGDQISISVQDLPDASSFSLLIEGYYDVGTGSPFSFEVANLNMPFSLSGGRIIAYAEKSEFLRVNYQEGSGGVIKTLSIISDESGSCTIDESASISAGVYNKLWLEGMTMDEATVKSRLNLVGTKTGPEDSSITFNVRGIDAGTLLIVVSIDGGAYVMSKDITLGSGSSHTPVPTTEVPTSTPTSTPIPHSSGSDNDDSDIPTTAPTPTQTEVSGESSISSIGKDVTFSPAKASTAMLMLASAADVPDDWKTAGDAYSLIFTGDYAGNSGTIVFTIPSSMEKTDDLHSFFIARYIGGSWTIMPSEVIGGSQVRASVPGQGTYALMYYSSDDAGTSTRTLVPTQGTVPTASSATATPEPAATQTPLPMIGLVAGIGMAAVCMRRI
ncbi:hypothetical protein [Methanogenium sp. MK-MG]|uniref:hypothetical protein n=1 Tax=Methanogenium sp. MK-MG TaxID=2599926 RepID=UPI0013EB3F40|nr:hypothetical protein [Methanogenium sp. MK-MG]KAF1078605.1 hypothetical protein MKMG_00459 [Methanogenium sp. MK-MG]